MDDCPLMSLPSTSVPIAFSRSNFGQAGVAARYQITMPAPGGSFRGRQLACLAGLIRRHEVSGCGGLTVEGRSRLDQVRLQAAMMFAEDPDASRSPTHRAAACWSVEVDEGLCAAGRADIC